MKLNVLGENRRYICHTSFSWLWNQCLFWLLRLAATAEMMLTSLPCAFAKLVSERPSEVARHQAEKDSVLLMGCAHFVYVCTSITHFLITHWRMPCPGAFHRRALLAPSEHHPRIHTHTHTLTQSNNFAPPQYFKESLISK